MKKCPSELELEAFLRQPAEESSARRRPTATAAGMNGMILPMAEQKPAGGVVPYAGDLVGFGFGDRNPMNGGGVGNQPWSQNLNALHPAISATIDSQSSFCAASPTSAHKPNGKENQAPGAGGTSGSDQSDTESIEMDGSPFEQGTDVMDIKRMRRMVSNRESARRSRKRKQAHLADLESQVDQLRGENSSLFKQLTDANQQFTTSVTDNRILKSDVEALRVKVKMAEDMVSRGALTCGIDRFLQGPIGSTQTNPRQQCRASSDVLPALDFQGDETCFRGISAAEQLHISSMHSIASLESLENRISSEVASCGVDWSWDSHSSGISK